jgi:hypothetical protein
VRRKKKRKKDTGTERQTDRQIHKKRTRAREFRSRETEGHSRLIIQVRRRKIETEKKKSMPMRGTTKEDMRREPASVFLVEQGGSDEEQIGRHAREEEEGEFAEAKQT